MSINFKRIISITFISVLLLGTLVGVLNEKPANAKSGSYVVYKVTNKSPRGAVTYKTSDVYMTKKQAKSFAAKNAMSVKTALINIGIGSIPGNYATIFGASKSVGDVVVPKTVNKTANKNKGVRLRFEKGNVVDIAGWNKSTKKANPSIKKINNKNVKQTIKVLTKG